MTVVGNTIWAVNGIGITAQRYDRSVISGNSVSNRLGITPSIGIDLRGPETVVVSNNNIFDTDSYGIYVYPFGDADIADDMILIGNLIDTPGDDGIRLETSSRSNITGNRIIGSAAHGIHVLTDPGNANDSDDCVLSANIIDAPVGDGIHIVNGDRTQVMGNKILNGVTEDTDAIYMENCDYGQVVNNHIYNWDAAATMVGIYWTDGVKGMICVNHITATSDSAIVLEDDSGTDPDDMTIRGNVCDTFGNHGIRTADADEVTISGNTLRDNTANGTHGIYVDNSDYYTINDNQIRNIDNDATCDSIHTLNSDEGLINGNNVHGSGRDGVRLEDTTTNTEVVNNATHGDGVTLGAGAGNQNDWGSGHNLNS